ncbi:MAG: hypothetical protein SAK29_32570 [Scytonema sp. PMC 1069.18]|nr:hypothetical protein [Scytonema sp. PMC 1069.18]MEC4885613.1 hypothetical protein [Scytonema sp. PMC 1070.18]
MAIQNKVGVSVKDFSTKEEIANIRVQKEASGTITANTIITSIRNKLVDKPQIKRFLIDGYDLEDDLLDEKLQQGEKIEVFVLLMSAEESQKQDHLQRAKQEREKRDNQPILVPKANLIIGSDTPETVFKETRKFNCFISPAQNTISLLPSEQNLNSTLPVIEDSEIVDKVIKDPQASQKKEEAIAFPSIPNVKNVLVHELTQRVYTTFNLQKLELNADFCKQLIVIAYLSSVGTPNLQGNIMSFATKSIKAFKDSSQDAYTISQRAGTIVGLMNKLFVELTDVAADDSKAVAAKQRAITQLKLFEQSAGVIASAANNSAKTFSELAALLADLQKSATDTKNAKQGDIDTLQQLRDKTEKELNTTSGAIERGKTILEKKRKDFEQLKDELTQEKDEQKTFRLLALGSGLVSSVVSVGLAAASPFNAVTSSAKKLSKATSTLKQAIEMEQTAPQTTKEKDKLAEQDNEINETKKKLLEKTTEIQETKEKIEEIAQNLTKKQAEDINQDIQKVKQSLDSLVNTNDTSSASNSAASTYEAFYSKLKGLFKDSPQDLKNRIEYLEKKRVIIDNFAKDKDSLKSLIEHRKNLADNIAKAGEKAEKSLNTYADSMNNSIKELQDQVKEARTYITKLEEEEENNRQTLSNLISDIKVQANKEIDIKVALRLITVTIIALQRLASIYNDLATFWQQVESAAKSLQADSLSSSLESISLLELDRSVALEWYYTACAWKSLNIACAKYHELYSKMGDDLDQDLKENVGLPDQEKRRALLKVQQLEKTVPGTFNREDIDQLKDFLDQQQKAIEQKEKDRKNLLDKATAMLAG